MENLQNISGIADDSQPNAGRIYDYFLGGDHNFEIDRIAAQNLLQVYPVAPKLLKTLRWFLGETVRRLLEEGFTQFLDFASGLPVQDHVHQISPSGTKVIYSDLDPVTVAYAQEIISDNPDVRYVHCNAAEPEKILNSGIVEEMFDLNKKVAIGFSGIAYFLTNEQLLHSMKTLYKWARKGDKLFLSDSNHIYPETHIIANEVFAKMGSPFHWRIQEKLKEIISDWSVVAPGFQNLDVWSGIDGMLTAEDFKIMGGNWCGVILEK